MDICALIALSVFKTVEFYVIISVIAAAVVAVVALPQRKGEVKTHLLRGEIVPADPDAVGGPGHGQLAIECLKDNVVVLRRDGLQPLGAEGAVSLVVDVSGFDVSITERLTAAGPHTIGCMSTSAVFFLDFLAPEWYHIHYESPANSEHAAFALHVRQGIKMQKQLIH